MNSCFFILIIKSWNFTFVLNIWKLYQFWNNNLFEKHIMWMEIMLLFITYHYFKLPCVEPLKSGNESKSSNLLNTSKTMLFTGH